MGPSRGAATRTHGPGWKRPGPAPGKATAPRPMSSPAHLITTRPGREPRKQAAIKSVHGRHKALLFTQDQVRTKAGDFHCIWSAFLSAGRSGHTELVILAGW